MHEWKMTCDRRWITLSNPNGCCIALKATTTILFPSCHVYVFIICAVSAIQHPLEARGLVEQPVLKVINMIFSEHRVSHCDIQLWYHPQRFRSSHTEVLTQIYMREFSCRHNFRAMVLLQSTKDFYRKKP